MNRIDPAQATPMGLQFEAYVLEPSKGYRYYGFPTADIWIGPGRVVVTARSLKIRYLPPIHRFRQAEYTWPTAVVVTRKPEDLIWAGAALLVEINGRVASVAVRGRRVLRDALAAAGFNVVEFRHWQWLQYPRPVPREVLGAHLDEVPKCVVGG